MSTTTAGTDGATTNTGTRPTNLQRAGAAAAIVYIGLAIVQYLFRDGLDIQYHILSLAENGQQGWIQVGNFLVTGALTIAAAVGLGRAMEAGRGSTWAPRLIGLYGAGLIGAGIFRADPAGGFPPGTPTGTPTFSGQGVTHFTVAGIGFLAVIAAAFVMAGRFKRTGQTGLRTYSTIAGAALVVAWVGLSAAPSPVTTVTFVIAALHASVWAGVVSMRAGAR